MLKRYLYRGRIGRTVMWVLLALIPVVMAMVFLSVREEFAQVRQLRATIEQTVETRDRLSELLVLHVDAETGVRGFVVTRNPVFLEPYEAALARRNAILASLQANADERVGDRLEVLRDLSNAKLANAQRNVADVREGRFDDARDRIAAGRGKAIMDRIRSEIATLEQSEAAKLGALTEAGRGSRESIENKVTGLLAVLSVLLMLVTLLIGYSIRERRKALDRAEQLYDRQKAMFDGAVDGMLLLDREGRIIRMNPSISRMFGYTETELVGRHNLDLMAEEYSLEQSMAWINSVGMADEHGAGRRQEFTGLRADGSQFETEVAISRVSGGEDHRYVAAIRDISERKHAERMKTEFVSTVSHELRTPLTSIGGSLGLLTAGAVGPLNDKAARLVEIAHSNCERLIRLINDILDIEKIESGKMDFDLRRMQVAPLVQRTVSAMRGFAEKHQVTLKVVLPPWPQCIKGDPDRLEQLLTNLVSNAIKHSPAGGEVEIFSGHAKGMVRIEVRDRGAGVPEAFRARIFGKFAMADASDSRVKGGTGLGLSIAREIARRHGGEVGFDDREGGGTAFHVDIPTVAAEAAPSPTPATHHLPTILHIDDDLDCLSVVASALEGKATVLPAQSLAEARSLLAKGGIDAAIVDVGLAEESGIDLIAEVREAANPLPVVLFTAIDEPHRDAGADRVLVKSRASIDDLAGATLDLLNGQKEAA